MSEMSDEQRESHDRKWVALFSAEEVATRGDVQELAAYHRLLDAERAKVARVEAKVTDLQHRGDYGPDYDDYSMGKSDGLRDAASELRAALANQEPADA